MFLDRFNLSAGSICLLLIFFVWYCFSSFRAWHQLRHIPAPSIFATFSYIWLARTTYSGRQYWIHRDLHQKYGPLVRVGPKEIFTDDTEIIKKISGAQSMYSRDSWYSTGRFNPYHDNLFTILEPGLHKKAKTRLAAAYSGRETPALEQGIDDQVKTLIRVLHERCLTDSPENTQPLLNLGTVSCYFTMDVITRIAFGEEIGCLRDDKDHFDFLRIVREVSEALKVEGKMIDFTVQLWPRMSTSSDVRWIRNILFSPLFLKLLGPKSTDKTGFGALMGVAKQHVSRRFASGGEHKDMLDSLISRGFSQQECEVEGLLMLLAGTESTACAIRAALLHIITSPKVYQTLKNEIKLAFRGGQVSSPILMEEAKLLPYLQAVVFESIRMRPPLLGLFPKVVPAPGDFFHGKHIPAGTSICMNVSAILRSPVLFGADVDIFRPERFLALDEGRRRELERNVEFAFGYGQWGCAGKPIALMEINKVVFELLLAFDIQMVSPMKPCDVQSYGVFLESDLSVKLTKDLDLSASDITARH